MEDDPKQSCQASSNSQERLKLIKEERRKQHEQRLGRTPLFPTGLAEESDTIKRFSKYRRSGSEKAVRKDASLDPPLSSRSEGDEGGVESSSIIRTEVFPDPDPSREHLWNISPVYMPERESNGSSVVKRPSDDLANPVPQQPLSHDSDGTEVHCSSFTSACVSPALATSLSVDQGRGVLKKPAIPAILRSATEPAAAFSGEDDIVTFKKPSILKKKDDSSISTTPSSSSGNNGQSASVSFELPVTASVLSRTKSIDSSLSGDTETGYWSGGESVGGILKSRRFLSDDDQGDQSSIMKSRRSSFGSSVVSNNGSEGGLQSILKRKLSYDSSYIMKEASANEYSFSTHSLPACGCLSPEPKPILKKKSNSGDLEEVEPKPILKHRTSRDYQEVVVEPEKTIKPCLKKSSSKSVDESFPCASVNFSPSSVSPVSVSEGASCGSSGTSKSILKKSGILKNAWRESASTSTSSSSSELDNTRPYQPAEIESDYLSSPFVQPVSTRESPPGLRLSRRFYRSEGDINTEDPGVVDDVSSPDISRGIFSAISPRFPSLSSRFEAPAGENGLPCSSNLVEQPHQHHHPDQATADLRDESNSRRRSSSGGSEANIISTSSSGIASATALVPPPCSSSFDSFQAAANPGNAPTEGYSSGLFGSLRNKLVGVKTVSPPPLRKLYDDGSEEGAGERVSVPESNYKFSLRRTSLGSSSVGSFGSSSGSAADAQASSSFSPFNHAALASSSGAGADSGKRWDSGSLYGRSKSVSDDDSYSSTTFDNNEEGDDQNKKKKEVLFVSTKQQSDNATRGLLTSSVLGISDSDGSGSKGDADQDGNAVRLSVAEKRSLFMQLLNDRRKKEELVRHSKQLHQASEEEEGDVTSSSALFLRPKRHTTQPVTTNEVEKAAENLMVQSTTALSEGPSISTPGTKDRNDSNAPSSNLSFPLPTTGEELEDKSLLTPGATTELESVSHKLSDLITRLEQSNIIHKDTEPSEGISEHYSKSKSQYKGRSMEQARCGGDDPLGTNDLSGTDEHISSPAMVASKPPTGAGLSKSRPRVTAAVPEGSFVARLARIHDERAKAEEIKSLPCTLPRNLHSRFITKATLSRVDQTVAVPGVIHPAAARRTRRTSTEGPDDLPPSPPTVSGEDGELNSLKDKIRMFNSLASTIQSEYKAVTKKTVTSKRFLTQPVVIPSSGHRRFEDTYEIGTLPSLPASVSSPPQRKPTDEEEEEAAAVEAEVAKVCAETDDLSSTTTAVKNNAKGQTSEKESECSQSLGATISSTSDDHLHSARQEEGEGSSNSASPSQDTLGQSVSAFRPPTPVYPGELFQGEEEGDRQREDMPEKILSSDSASSSNEDGASDGHGDHATRCVKRRSKSSSVSSMMMSPESQVNPFGKGNKVNRNSIADKIAALQTNGEISWKKRVMKINPDYPAKDKTTVPPPPTDQNDNVEIRKNNRDSSIIANRLSQLESSQETWKKRVGENDANIFTVQGRLERAGKIGKGSSSSADGPGSPPKESKVKSLSAKVIAPIRFRTKDSPPGTTTTSGDSSPPPKAAAGFSPPKEELSPRQKNSANEPPAVKLGAVRKQYSRSDTGSSSEAASEEEKIVVRSVFQNDNETFSKFFSPISESVKGGGRQAGLKLSNNNNVQIDESSFEAIQPAGGRLGGIRKNVRAPRNHTSTKNPVRSLASRLQQQTYVELSPQVREKEIKKRMQIDNLTKNAPLSVEALAGLASKEDFTAVKLKKAGITQRAKDFPHPMLIRIKGKRQVQTRVVAPEVTSLSSGDNYILVTANKLYQFIGEYSNRLERAKIADVVSHIVQKKDLGCRISSMTEVATLEEPLIGGRDQDEFFKLLGGGNIPDAADDLGDESDEAYESGIVATNRVYEVDQIRGVLVPLSGSAGGWGTQPRFSLLQDDKVLVFDFVTEVYVWSGSRADPELKKIAYHLAKEMFEGQYDEPDGVDARLSKPLEGLQRPNWCFLRKINQHMEPILFIEKFFDWPDDSGRLIKVQQLKKNSDGTQKEASYNFTPCDVQEMLKLFADVGEPELELEGFNVGRGTEVDHAEDRRTFQIATLNVKAWNISEFAKCEVESSALGQFYSEETYVIRWQFSVSQIGRDLKGNISKHSGTLGRERCTYFFWQGKNSRITEQGTSALMTVELDREKGPQVRVEQGKEPPAFLNLFQGLMFVHLESREAPVKDAKLYVAMGATETEGHFLEVPCHPSSFRSLGSFILVDCVKGRVYLWHGKLSNDVTRAIANKGAAAIVDSPQRHINVHGTFRLIQFQEGEENALFFNCLGVQNAKRFMTEYCPIRDRTAEDFANTRVFVFSSIQGSFEANPVFSVRRKKDSPEAFPILQEELYNSQQPRLFLISRGSETWLWQGWQPLGDEENENTATGSGEIRWAAERKAALQTAVSFCEATGTKGLLILAGFEPTRFTNLFPYWTVVEEAREANMAEGRTVGLTIPVEQELQKFISSRTYTFEELQERPEGIDQSKLETYLSDEEFESILKMDREEFNKLQAWKQNELKKAVGLF